MFAEVPCLNGPEAHGPKNLRARLSLKRHLRPSHV